MTIDLDDNSKSPQNKAHTMQSQLRKQNNPFAHKKKANMPKC